MVVVVGDPGVMYSRRMWSADPAQTEGGMDAGVVVRSFVPKRVQYITFTVTKRVSRAATLGG